jgi:transposase
VIEDLDLSGCKGSKRFAYTALQGALSRKAVTEKVNPAYTSQMCPSCGYVNRNNRSGTVFKCRCCGREGHADFVGGLNLLGRSEDKQVKLQTPPKSVKAMLSERYLRKRSSSLGSPSVGARTVAPKAYCEGIGPPDTRIASNPVYPSLS